MVFSSSVFLFLFLPLTIMGYFLAPGIRSKNIFLLLASLFFYSWGEIHYVIVLLLSVGCNTWFGNRIERFREHAKLYLILAIVVNLILLGYFKYANFVVDNLNLLLISAGLDELANRKVHLPLGISFFTFQAMSYIVDVYRGTAKAQKNFFNVALYISLFPQLIAGPIVRYGDISTQLTERHSSMDDIAWGVRRFTIGLAKKVLIANVVGQAADEIFAHDSGQLDYALAWLGIICYALQIYFDFSGYSDMAIGLGRIFGFKFPENFNQPYTSRSAQEFWQRWHMSLSGWFRDYLYIPLGGNRHGDLRTYFNLVLVFFLCGLWHGASWSFVVWGLFHGGFLVLERSSAGGLIRSMPNIIRHAYLILVVLIGWVFFRAETLPYALEFIASMFGFGDRSNDGYFMVFVTPKLALVLGIAVFICAWPALGNWSKRLCDLTKNDSGATSSSICILRDIAIVGLLFLSAVFVTAQSYNPFIYFRF
ncbi:MAG: alginate O-acetyltransferase complex protein AlgI [Parasphingorhabdus sp.]|jgi:alginate O-acetyltransferase complex protein AlgI